MARKDTELLVRLARKAGALVRRTGSGHYRIINPATGQAVTMSVSPSCHFSLQKQRRDLERIGIVVQEGR